MSSDLVDDKSSICIPFLLSHIASHKQSNPPVPFFLGLNGVQGAGKTTLVTTLESTLSSPPHSLPTLSLSIDDFYLPRTAQQQLTDGNPENPLLAQRGQPGTHDLTLCLEVLGALRRRDANVRIPSYDKSAFAGKGDRVDEREWKVVNKEGESKIEVVLLEGWCVGFRALQEGELEDKLKRAQEDVFETIEGDHKVFNTARARGRLGRHKLKDLKVVNEAVRSYDAITDQFDAFIHLDAEDTQYVYDWRLEQEATLRKAKGRGMTDGEVVTFINGYYPSYELFTDRLKSGVFGAARGKQLRVVVDHDRRVKLHEVI